MVSPLAYRDIKCLRGESDPYNPVRSRVVFPLAYEDITGVERIELPTVESESTVIPFHQTPRTLWIGFEPTYHFWLSAFGADAPPAERPQHKRCRRESNPRSLGCNQMPSFHLATTSTTVRGLEPLSHFYYTCFPSKPLTN